MIYEWDPAKAAANIRKHSVSFEEAALCFLIRWPSPSSIPITLKTRSVRSLSAVPLGDGFSSWRIPNAEIASESSAHDGQLVANKNSMRKASMKRRRSELRSEYDLGQLKGVVRGKYYQRALAGTNLVLLEPDVARAFPDSNSVNRALRRLLPDTRARGVGRRHKTGNGKRRATG